MKKIWIILLSILAVILSSLGLSACSEGDKGDLKYSEGLEYTLTFNGSGGEYQVIGIGTCKDNDIYVPLEHLGKPVTSIGNYAFKYCSSLTSVVIGNSVTSIGSYAFYGCDLLQTIEIPNSVTSIGSSAFSGCPVEKVTMPALAISYVKNANLKEVIITSGRSIDSSAFFACYSLTSVVIPDSVTSIGSSAFSYCYSLKSVKIGNGVTSIGDRAFDGCSSLQYNVEGDLKYLGNTTNPYLYLADTNSTSITSATINSNCKFIGSNAFSGCSSLEAIEIPNSVTSIGGGAFYNCSKLTSIVIPDSVTSIGNYAFKYCSSLTSVVIGNSVTSIGDDAFEYCHSLKIYCEAESKPDGWDSDWNSSNRPVVWGYKGN